MCQNRYQNNVFMEVDVGQVKYRLTSAYRIYT